MKSGARDSDKVQKSAAEQARDVAFFEERDRVRAENAAKTARLRTLRLAKEAAEREAAQQAQAERPPSTSSKKKRPSSP
ncbi:MAG: hypothetical protein ACXWNN_14155 [Candidatus Binataceae bacterium]